MGEMHGFHELPLEGWVNCELHILHLSRMYESAAFVKRDR
jgi:hypothetical protein